jgi:two-component system chemotaxis sensor kinase CheA
VIDPGNQSRAAVRLSTVARLEEFDSATVEHSGRNDVVQYRGEIMPLIYLNGYSPAGSDGESAQLNTVVFGEGNRSVGIVVGKVIDIVSQRFNSSEARLPQRCVVQDRVTEIIDLTELVRANHPEILQQA